MKETILLSEKRSEIAALARKYDITLLALFGSQATGKTHARSDADFAFSAKRKLRPREIAQCAFDLGILVEFPRVELTDIHDAPPLLLKHIAMEGRAVYESDPRAFILFRIYAIKRFMEAKKLLSLRAASLDAFLRRKQEI